MRNVASVLSDYKKAANGEYEARLIIKDNNINLVDITLSVPDEEIAVSICDNWQRNNQEIYKFLVDKLF
jgi:hypothetical protein